MQSIKNKKKVLIALTAIELVVSVAALVLDINIRKAQREEEANYEGKHLAA